MKKIYNQFNGIRELMNREDAGMELPDKYEMKRSREDLFGGLNPVASILIMARIQNVETELKSGIADLSNDPYSGQWTDFDVTSIYQQAKSYENE